MTPPVLAEYLDQIAAIRHPVSVKASARQWRGDEAAKSSMSF